MADYGLTAEGFIPKTFEISREERNARLRDRFGVKLDLSDESPLGAFVAIQTERETTLWELAEAVYHSSDRRSATGDPLESLAALTGTIKEAAAPSSTILTLTGDDTTVVTEGSRVSILDTEIEFQTTEDVTLETVDSWIALTLYAVGDRVTNASRIYICRTAGTSAASGGPVDGAEDVGSDDITDGTVHWRFVGDGEAAGDVEAKSIEFAPIVAVAFSLSVIETPTAGWSSVMNLDDAEVGNNIETDPDLRIRAQDELATPGTSTIEAIRADLIQLVDKVKSVTVFQNVTDITDGDGMPPHSVEALVRGGDDQDIFEQLFRSVSGGIRTFGTESGTVEDAQGFSQDIEFSRPVEIDIYISIEVDVDEDKFPEDGEEQIKLAIVAYGDVQKTGHDAWASAISAQAFKVVGMLNVKEVLLDVTPSPAISDPVVVALRELAVYDTSRIDVTVNFETP